MINGEIHINEVVNLMEDLTMYLHSLLCTMGGKYRPCDIRSVRKTVQIMMVERLYDVEKVIDEFKSGILTGNIITSTFAFGLSDEQKKKLYEVHLNNIKEFEEKYNIKHEESKEPRRTE